MSIGSRVRRLETKLKPDPSCPGCGYPQKGVMRVVITPTQDPLPQCKVCSRPLDKDGAPLQTPFKRIILPRADEAFPPP